MELLFFSPMKIISFNVNGLTSYIKYIQDTFEMSFNSFLLTELKVDILCIQEVRSSSKNFQETVYFNDFNMYTNHNTKKNGYCGVAILIKKTYIPKNIKRNFDFVTLASEYGRLIEIEFDNFKVLNVYLPFLSENSQDSIKAKEVLNFYEKFMCMLINLENVIVCGDFNAVYQLRDHYLFKHEYIYLKSNINKVETVRKDKVLKKSYKQTELPYLFSSVESLEEYFMQMPQRKCLYDFVHSKTFVDCFDYFYEKGQRYTCWDVKLKNREKNLGMRLDYIFVSSDIKDRICNAGILNQYEGSDHCPVVLEIDLEVKCDVMVMDNRRNTILSYFKKSKVN